MGATKLPALTGASAEKLDAIRTIILGPQIHELERKLDKLARQVEQLQAGLDTRGARQTRRAARHRYLTTMKVKKLAQAVDSIVQYLHAENKTRAASMQQLATLTRQLGLSKSNSASSPVARARKKTPSHERRAK